MEPLAINGLTYEPSLSEGKFNVYSLDDLAAETNNVFAREAVDPDGERRFDFLRKTEDGLYSEQGLPGKITVWKAERHGSWHVEVSGSSWAADNFEELALFEQMIGIAKRVRFAYREQLSI